MLVFRGKIEYHTYAKDENITVIFPEDLAARKPVLLYWQWTVNAWGKAKADVNYHGFIESVKVETGDNLRLGITNREYYRFDGELSQDGLTLTLIMTSINQKMSPPMILKQSYPVNAKSEK